MPKIDFFRKKSNAVLVAVAVVFLVALLAMALTKQPDPLSGIVTAMAYAAQTIFKVS